MGKESAVVELEDFKKSCKDEAMGILAVSI